MELMIFNPHMISLSLLSTLRERGSASGVEILRVIRRGNKHAKGERQEVWFFLASRS